MWQVGDAAQAIKVSAPAMYGVPRYERTCVMVNVDAEHFYILDVFEVEGGQDHTFFLRGPESTLTTRGLELAEGEPFSHGTKMRDLCSQTNVDPGWSATWRHAHAQVNVRYTGLSEGMSVGTTESWVSKGRWTYEDLWIPTLMVRNQGEEGLKSAFVGVIDVYGDSPAITGIEKVIAGGIAICVRTSAGTADNIGLFDEDLSFTRKSITHIDTRGKQSLRRAKNPIPSTWSLQEWEIAA
jgi:hypothetical protein